MRLTLLSLLLLATINLQPSTSRAATVTGTLRDISIQALNTKLMFAPTTNVLLTASGLSAGPPKTIDTTNGQFTIILEAGDYTASLPLISWRRPFPIYVPDTSSTLNITNLLINPHAPGGGPSALIHVNTNRVIAWSTNAETALLDAPPSLAAGTLVAGRAITIEAFGSFSDPSANAPSATFKLKLGATTLVTSVKTITTGPWQLRAAISIRSAGPAGTAVAIMTIMPDAGDLFPSPTQTATIDTTASQPIDLTAAIDDYTQAENVICDQFLIHLW